MIKDTEFALNRRSSPQRPYQQLHMRIARFSFAIAVLLAPHKVFNDPLQHSPNPTLCFCAGRIRIVFPRVVLDMPDVS